MVTARALPIRIGVRVKKAREDLGLTQAQLAGRLRLEPVTIRSVEAGRRGLSLETLVSVAKALHVPPSALLEGDAPDLSPLAQEVAELVGELDEGWQRTVLEVVRSINAQVAQAGRRGHG